MTETADTDRANGVKQQLILAFSFVPPNRIRKCGGFVAWNSVGQPHVNGRLAMTRSIGDLDLKNSGVIAQPETKRIQVKEGPNNRDSNGGTKGHHRYMMQVVVPTRRVPR